MKAYYVMRKDLNMTPAKLAVQVGHGSVILSQKIQRPTFEGWIENFEMKKIVVQVDNEEKLKNIYNRFSSEMDKIDKYWGTVACEEIWDNGHTEFDGRTLTGIVLFIKEEVPSYIKRLRLYS